MPMDAAIRQFSQKLNAVRPRSSISPSGTIQYEGRNFLIPIDGTIASDLDIRSNAVDGDLILDPLIVARPRGSAVILDAARRNPWQQKTSVKAPGSPTSVPSRVSSLTLRPLRSWRNKGNTLACLLTSSEKPPRVPGRTFKEAFSQTRAAVAKESRNKQLPWEVSLETADFVVTSRSEPTDMASRAVSRLGSPPDTVEKGFWDTIKSSNSAADFQAYLDAYPNGPYVSEARSSLQRLGALAKARQSRKHRL